MIIIGVDPHKSSHTATAVDPATGQPVASITVPASTVGYRRLWRWAARFDQRRWAIENARGLERHLAQWLVHRNEHVVDVPATATTRVRELSRGGRRKNDTIDASAAACVAALDGDATVVAVEDHTDVFAVLEERRANLAAQRVRLVNQLRAQLRDLVAGGATTDLTATTAAALLRRLRPAPPPIRLAATSPTARAAPSPRAVPAKAMPAGSPARHATMLEASVTTAERRQEHPMSNPDGRGPPRTDWAADGRSLMVSPRNPRYFTHRHDDSGRAVPMAPGAERGRSPRGDDHRMGRADRTLRRSAGGGPADPGLSEETTRRRGADTTHD